MRILVADDDAFSRKYLKRILDKWGYEVWQLEGENPADPDEPHYVLPILGEPGPNPGNIGEQRAYWVNENTIAWAAADSSANTYTLHYAPNGGLAATDTGITGAARSRSPVIRLDCLPT